MPICQACFDGKKYSASSKYPAAPGTGPQVNVVHLILPVKTWPSSGDNGTGVASFIVGVVVGTVIGVVVGLVVGIVIGSVVGRGRVVGSVAGLVTGSVAVVTTGTGTSAVST
jgi:hypothetical protein